VIEKKAGGLDDGKSLDRFKDKLAVMAEKMKG
jgi:hypothetical protein